MAEQRRKKQPQKKSGKSLKAQRTIIRTILILCILGSIIYMITATISSLDNIFFANNPYFNLKKYKIEVVHKGTLTDINEFRQQLEKIVTSIEQDQEQPINLFELDLRAIRDTLLSLNKQIDKVKIVRKLPEGLEVTAIDKKPIARLFNRKGPFIDRTGYVIPTAPGLTHLPIIFGIHDRETIKAGDVTINKDVNDTLELMNHLAISPYGPLFEAIVINCSHLEQITLLLHESAYTKRKCAIVIPRSEISGALSRAAKILDKRQSDNKLTSFIDATYKINVPVR